MVGRLPFHLALRNNAHMISVIRENGRTRETLGVAYPEDGDRRHRILEQWGIDARSPREAQPATIDLPLERRKRVATLSQLDSATQQRLTTGFGTQPRSRRDTEPGLLSRMHLGVPTPLEVHAPWAPRRSPPAGLSAGRRR